VEGTGFKVKRTDQAAWSDEGRPRSSSTCRSSAGRQRDRTRIDGSGTPSSPARQLVLDRRHLTTDRQDHTTGLHLRSRARSRNDYSQVPWALSKNTRSTPIVPLARSRPLVERVVDHAHRP
jgi:hypothetical protein